MTASVLTDENYEDHNQEVSIEPDEAPEDDKAGEKSRLRFKYV